jgi:hypothetical protein
MTVHDEGKALVKAILDRKGVKLCTKCGLAKPFSEFRVAYIGKNGQKSYRTECKACKNEQRKEWRKFRPNNPALLREQSNTKKIVAQAQKETLANAPQYALVWSEDEERKILDNLSLTNKNLALLLGRSYSAVCGRKTILRQRGLL